MKVLFADAGSGTSLVCVKLGCYDYEIHSTILIVCRDLNEQKLACFMLVRMVHAVIF